MQEAKRGGGGGHTATRAPNSAALEDIVVPALCWSPVGVELNVTFVAFKRLLAVDVAGVCVSLERADAVEASINSAARRSANMNMRL